MKALVVPAALFALALVVGCDKPIRVGGGPVGGGGGGGVVGGITGGPSVPTADGVISYDFHEVKDQGALAYTYLMPKDWTNNDAINWAPGPPRYPVAALITTSPDHRFALAVYPMLAGATSNGPMSSSGEAYENAADAIDKTMAKDEHVSNYQVVHTDTQAAQTQWPQGMGGEGQADMAITRCTFTEDGIDKEGVIVGRLDTFSAASQYTSGKLWHLSLSIMSAPRGELDSPEFLREAVTFFDSASITPEYNQMINNVAVDSSQVYRKVAQEEDENIMKTYWDAQKANGKEFKDFDDYIRGVQNYANPNGGPPISLPSNGNYWINPQGTIQQSPNSNYNPNQGGGNWSQMNAAPQG